ncbi:MAG TPA: hypothetical protein VNE42_01735 [Acidimicrobiales bacterium]|nr:hypothetical protein [Acidimicrobiales bacterium]
MVRLALGTLLGSLALFLFNTFAPATAATNVAPVDLSAVIVASHAPVSAAGGVVLVDINLHGALSCRVVINPPVRIRPIGLACHSLKNAYRATIGMNPRLQNRRFVFTVIAESSDRQLVRHLVIEQARAPNLIDNYARVSAYGVYGNGENDAVGDCTLATAADLLQTWDAMNGLANGPLAAQPFLDAYHTLVGGPGGPNVGLTVRQVLNYWQHIGIDNNLISSWHSISAYRNPAQIEGAMARNGALYGSVALPSTDMNFLPLWSMTEAPYGTPVAGGHALAIVGYDARGPYLATWGGVQHATWQWWKTWGTGAFVVKPTKTSWTPNVVSITSSTLSGSVGTTNVNGVAMYEVNLNDEVSGVTGPTSGTITFSDNGQPINGCSSIPGTASGPMLTARCTEYIPFNASRSDTFVAQFSGDSAFGDSTSNATFVTFG